MCWSESTILPLPITHISFAVLLWTQGLLFAQLILHPHAHEGGSFRVALVVLPVVRLLAVGAEQGVGYVQVEVQWVLSLAELEEDK